MKYHEYHGIRDIDGSTDLYVDDEKPSYLGSDVQPTTCSNANKQLSTQDDVMRNVHENTPSTNEDHNSVLCDKELCEGTIKSFSCTRCEMHFTSMEELTSHCETHKTTMKHKCTVCEKSYARKNDLTEHLRTHQRNGEERPFKSDDCDQRFARKDSLTRHLRIHSGERLFKCDVCDKSFTQKCHLTEHLRIHSGEQPFKCEVCDKCFTQKSSLTAHLQIHSRERPL